MAFVWMYVYRRERKRERERTKYMQGRPRIITVGSCRLIEFAKRRIYRREKRINVNMFNNNFVEDKNEYVNASLYKI